MKNIYKKTFFGLVLIAFALAANAQNLKQINIQIEQDSINILEANPYSNDDLHGNFIIGTDTFTNIELHYRGAWYLWTLMNQGSLRNWKVKFPKSNRFENRREWNFNYENYIRQNLAYHVFRQAGVPVVSSENVILSVNGQHQGLYLKYDDPDNKRWLTEVFGDNDGDLYKAAFDMPNEPKKFADLTYLGNDDSDYFLHYRKQTNKKDAAEFDYSSIRNFTALINHTADEDFEDVILENFAVEEFIEYLVVANFIANWDSYPYRPKNYFLYDNPEDGKWHFIPWDLDGTFQENGNRNPIGTTGSIFHYFDGIAPYNHTANEPLNRPLVWRLMANDMFRDKYCYEYHKAMDTYLSESYLYAAIDSIALVVANNVTGQDLTKFNQDVAATKNFIFKRTVNVQNQLNSCVITNDPFLYPQEPEPVDTSLVDFVIYPNPATDFINIQLPNSIDDVIDIQTVNMLGQVVKTSNIAMVSNNVLRLNINHLQHGQYVFIIKTMTNTFKEKVNIINE